MKKVIWLSLVLLSTILVASCKPVTGAAEKCLPPALKDSLINTNAFLVEAPSTSNTFLVGDDIKLVVMNRSDLAFWMPAEGSAIIKDAETCGTIVDLVDRSLAQGYLLKPHSDALDLVAPKVYPGKKTIIVYYSVLLEDGGFPTDTQYTQVLFVALR